jgi:hypothetical protein
MQANKIHHVSIPGLGRFAIARDPNGEGQTSQIFVGHLKAVHINDQRVLQEFDLGSGVVTTAGVKLLAADWTNATATLKLSNYHDSGTGTTAAATSDTALQTATGNSRVAGTQSGGTSNNIYQTVATLAYTATAAITEWGLFTASTSGTLWDRKVFTAINVVNGDSIQFTYQLTCVAGG